MPSRKIKSWGRVEGYSHEIVSVANRADVKDNFSRNDTDSSALAFGMGRSYGDSNLNENGTLIKTTRMKSFLSADWDTGVIKAQAGLTLDELLQVAVPKGWFLPVTPGSKFVTLGGALANNVHGKNHHKVGSFGNYVKSFALHRTDRKIGPIICTAKKNVKLFNVTIGGLGLSGLIEWVEIQLKPIESAYLKVENIPYSSIDDFFKLSEDSNNWEYTVAWIDCFAKGKELGRGIFSRANFSDQGALDTHEPTPKLRWPFVTPAFLLNKSSIKVFNWLYRIRPGARYVGYTHYDPFFYPLDGISEWNKLYGKKGFFQHQCLIPPDSGKAAIIELLQAIEASGQGSFLAVLKVHGPETSPGSLSFCMEGLSLALDFANKGRKTRDLLRQLDEIVEKYSGRLYPAKDGHMSAELFKLSYPMWKEIERNRDPKLSSSFWRRVTQNKKDI